MTPKSPELGLYLHVPFCHARCGYCDFVTFTGKEDRIDRYVSDLCQEIVMMSSPAAAPLPSSPAASGGGTIDDGPPTGAFGGDGFKVSTIFFGGVTRSLLDTHHVSKILSSVRSNFNFAPDQEIAIEDDSVC